MFGHPLPAVRARQRRWPAARTGKKKFGKAAILDRRTRDEEPAVRATESDWQRVPGIFPIPITAGLVIGCYGWPSLARLQILVARALCGQVPILISDDGSPDAAALRSLCAEYSDVEFSPNPARLGHYAGDLSAFRKGIDWAAARGLDALVKLSQRFVPTRAGWIAELLPLLADAETVVGPLTAGREAKLYWRTEAVAMRVAEWSTIARPKLDGDVLMNATELRFNDIIVRTFGRRAVPWPGLSNDRNRPSDGTVWHTTHPRSAYVDLAKRHGIELEASFYVDGHNRKPNWKRG
jgi:hypothetical protein